LGVATSLSQFIFERPEFRKDFVKLTKDELWEPSKGAQFDEDGVGRLIQTAVIFSLSETDAHKKMAYKIAIYLFRQYRHQFDNLPIICQLVLARLGDIPSILNMVKSEGTKDYFAFVPRKITSGDPLLWSSIQYPEVSEKKVFNQTSTAGGIELSLTDFQSKLLNHLRESHDVAFSAPTSAGKSFLILNYLAEQLYKAKHFTAIYVVPTRALMAEVQSSTNEIAKLMGISKPEFIVLNSTSILNYKEVVSIPKKVLVLTQERLQEMLSNRMTLPVDLLVLDEAQKVGDGDRGIVIEDSVQELIRENPKMQKIIVSPYIKNLLKYADIFEIPKEQIVTETTRKSPVGQSILFVTFQRNPERRSSSVTLSVYIPEIDYSEVLATIGQGNRLPTSTYERKAWVAKHVIKDKEPTIIYCDGPAQCRNVGKSLIGHFVTPHDSVEVDEAIDYLKEHVHPTYYLAELLRFGVGYHYGKMPQFIRFFVKRLFESKQIEFLCCTSTLMEGVNLPAKNLIIYKPKAGEPMSTLAVRNLIGRAGRLNRDYYGKIYCINYEEWAKDKAPFNDELETVSSASEDTLLKHADSLIRYLENPDSITKDPNARAVITFATSLLMKSLLRPNVDPLRRYRLLENAPKEKLDKIAGLVQTVLATLTPLAKEVILQNRSIDPRFQLELYQELKLEHSVMPLPLTPSDYLFYERLVAIFRLISVHLMRDPKLNSKGTVNRAYQHFAYVAAKWIAQAPYKQILESQIIYERGLLTKSQRDEIEGPEKHRDFVNHVIEVLDSNLEDKIRYDYTRMLKCYIDIAEQILKERNRKASYCRELPIYLEAGASDPNVLILLDAGLSRNTAIEISGYILKSYPTIPRWQNITEAVGWLRENNQELKNAIHSMLYKEVEELII
jgi:superfamily II DNA/RNA helicase